MSPPDQKVSNMLLGKSRGQLLCLMEKVSSDAIKNNIARHTGGSVVKNPPANAGDKDLIPGPGRS